MRMNVKKQVSKRVASNSVKNKPIAKKVAKKLPLSSAKSKKKPPSTASKKPRVAVKKRGNQQSLITKKKTAPKLTSALKASAKKIAPRKQSNRSLKKTIETEVERVLQLSVLPLIQNLILERNNPEKTSQAGALTLIDRDNALVNTLIASVSKLQDAIERLSTSIEQKLIQAKPVEVKPPEVKPPEVKPNPAPAAQAQPPAPAPAPQAPPQAKPE